VLVVVFREIPKFDRQREGSFRAWLRQVTVNRVRTLRRQRRRRPTVGLDPAEGFLDQLADPNGDLAREWDADHDRHVVQKLLAVVQPDFTPTTWEAFQKFALDGLPAARVAQDLGLSENAVIKAKSRILKRLRAEAGELLG
jgi:RNA polymerase sigma-70 factor, ECF subfamily